MLDMTFGDANSAAAKERAAARRYRHAGTVLIVLALVLPWLLRPVAGAYEAGRLLGETLGGLLLFLGVAWLVTLKGSELAKARGRLVVGVLLCLVATGSVTQARKEREDARRFMADALALQAEYKAKFDSIEKRFEAINLGQHTTAQAMVAPQSLAAGRAALAQFRALLQERQRLLQAYLTRYRAFLDGVPPGPLRQGAEKSWAPSSEAARKLYAELDTVQFAVADRLEALFDWVQANRSRLAVQEGKLMFQTEAQRAAALKLATQLDEAVAKALEVEKTAETAQAEALARQQKARQEAEALLGR